MTWEELGRTKGGNQYTVLNLGKRLGSLKQDPWEDIGRLKQKLPQDGLRKALNEIAARDHKEFLLHAANEFRIDVRDR